MSCKHPVQRTSAVELLPNGHRALQYQGSGGLDRNSTCLPTDGPAPGKLQQRSMSADSIVDLELDIASGACRPESSTTADQQDRKRSGKLQETWQQVKKVFSAKLDAGGTTAGGRTKILPSEKLAKSASKKTARSASTTGTAAAKTEEPSSALQLLTVQQPGQHSRSVSPRTPSTVDGADSSSGRVPSNTGSSSVGMDIGDRTLAGK